ncbi:MAG: short-chain alcohol dehydrogenase [Proteobacteria bacterium]|nr:short-chain alcohol dehydrogenase [Pseudomonadota bacterium]
MVDTVALITGSGSGIGKAIALALADAVDVFVLVGRDLDKLQKVRAQLRERQCTVHTMRVDLSSAQDLLGLQTWINEQLNRLDILVHSAGGIRSGAVGESTIADLDWHYAVNLRAPFLLTQTCLPLLRAVAGQIVFVNSSAGLAAKPQLAGYCATKSALKAFADSLRAEENANGVRVLSVYPGRTATPMQEGLFKQEGRAYSPALLLQPEDVAQTVVSSLKLPRTAEVTDLMVRGMKKV